MKVDILRLISSLASLILITSSAYLISGAIAFTGLRFDAVALGVIAGAMFLRKLDTKLLNLLLTRLS